MYIKTAFSTMEREAETLGRFAAALRGFEQSVSGTVTKLSALNMGSYHPNPALQNIMQEILDRAARMDTFSAALSEIVQSYRSVEEGMLSRASEQGTQADDENGSGGIVKQVRDAIRDILLSLGIIKAEKQTRIEGEPVTSRQQHEMDLYLQQEIKKMRKENRFSEKTWKNSDLDERKAILQEYVNQIALLMGLPVGAINWTYREPTYSGNQMYFNMGAYSPDTNRININAWVLEHGDGKGIDTYGLLRTLAHEMRHYYQNEAVRHPDQYVVTEETIRAWQESIDNYKSQSQFMAEGMTEAAAYQAYRDQEIERDARHFAGQD